MESRLVDLEARYTHLERQVAELSDVVFAQQRAIDVWFAKTGSMGMNACNTAATATFRPLRAALRCGELVRIAAAGTVGAAGKSSPQSEGFHLHARAPSGGATLVPMVQAADLGQLDHLTGLGRHHCARRGRVLADRQMRARAIVVGEVGCEDSLQMALAEYDHMVETLAADRADKALNEGVLPGRARRAQDFLDAHSCESVAEGAAVDPVAVAHQVRRRAGRS